MSCHNLDNRIPAHPDCGSSDDAWGNALARYSQMIEVGRLLTLNVLLACTTKKLSAITPRNTANEHNEEKRS